MNMIEAARETMWIVRGRLIEIAEAGDQAAKDVMRIAALPEALQPKHLDEMLALMEADKNPQDSEGGFSEGKLGRWLGWMQAAACAMGLLSLDESKEINKRWKE